MTRIASAIEELRREIPCGVELVAVSKFHPAEAIEEAYAAGQRRFGESRVQELLKKQQQLPADIEWHFIGHLQTNKVRQLMGRVSLIESVDTEHLLEAIVTARVLMQLHVAREETKFGFTPEELLDYFGSRRFERLQATHICGMMGMASNTDDTQRVRSDFRQIAEVFRAIRHDETLGLRGFDTLSMGMSGDWPIAVEEGATIVRVGTRIFGERDY